MSTLVYLNGAYRPRGDAVISVDDRGFVFGDGVYEVIRVVEGKPYEAVRHCARLADGLAQLRIGGEGVPGARGIMAIARRLLDENGLASGEATIYVQVTRGAAPRTHVFPPAGTPPTVYIAVNRLLIPGELHDHGAAAITHPDLRWTRCDIKSVNLLPNVLAKQRAAEKEALEAILVRDGVITEGSHTSVFGVLDGRLRTFPLSNYILPGITRAVVIELGRELSVAVREVPIRIEELPRLEELFLTGTTTDVMPVVELDGRPVADGRPGRITRMLYERLRERMVAD